MLKVSCCCGISRRSGSLFVLYLYLGLAALAFASLTSVSDGSRIYTEMLLLVILKAGLSILGIIGIHKEKPSFLLPIIMYACCIVTILLASAAFLFVVAYVIVVIFENTHSEFMRGVALAGSLVLPFSILIIVISAFYAYTLLLLYNYHSDMKQMLIMRLVQAYDPNLKIEGAKIPPNSQVMYLPSPPYSVQPV